MCQWSVCKTWSYLGSFRVFNAGEQKSWLKEQQ